MASAHIEYGTTTAYGSSVATGAPALSASQQTLSAMIGGLQSFTAYHFRVVVGNGSGTVAGPDQTFRTADRPPRPGAQEVQEEAQASRPQAVQEEGAEASAVAMSALGSRAREG